MEVSITSVINPFSFFCIEKEGGKNVLLNTLQTGDLPIQKSLKTEWEHGQYVAVMWQRQWVRGIVSMETQFLIWLVDHGFFIRPRERTTCIPLPNDLKRIPSGVFEASIHGVMPVDKVMNESCEIEDVISNTWNPAAIHQAEVLIDSATKTFFQPVALLSTKNNVIVLGDLYLEIPRIGTVNLIDELEEWPVFLLKNKEAYVKNLSQLYTTRWRHRACKLNVNFTDLPTITPNTSIKTYHDICDSIPTHVRLLNDSDSQSEGASSTVINYDGTDKRDAKSFGLTAEELEKYAHMYVDVHGREYNMLNVLANKTRDLNMCERYKDHDEKSVGRGTYRSSFI